MGREVLGTVQKPPEQSASDMCLRQVCYNSETGRRMGADYARRVPGHSVTGLG